MTTPRALGLRLLLSLTFCGMIAARPVSPASQNEDLLITNDPAGRRGGRLVFALRTEPKTLNPVLAKDGPSREVIGLMNADLLHINRATQETEAALARSWKVSRDGLRYTLELRRGLRFSDGQPCDADDVVFSFQAVLDEKTGSPQRDLLLMEGKPAQVRKTGPLTVEFDLPEPYAAGDRLFDSFAILPRHLLEAAYRSGTLQQAWKLGTPPGEIAGLGPFRLKEYAPGERLVLERNPYYWKADRQGTRLPYLDEMVLEFVASEDAQVLRFEAGETDIIDRLGADNFAAIEAEGAARHIRAVDAGPGLEYTFLFFNLNALDPAKLPETARKQAWFQDVRFRQAVSAAIDREAIVRLVYRGRATPLGGNVTPGNKLWLDESLPKPARSPERARELLRSAGFSWTEDGRLIDAKKQPVEFTIISSTSNAQRMKIATLVQDDLKSIGMSVTVVPLEFRALLDRVFQTHDFEACVLSLGGGDADPNGEINVWASTGATHLWHLGEEKPATPWEAEIDRLMREQMGTLDRRARKRLYDRVQKIVAENLPLLCLVSPHVLVAAKDGVENFHPAVLEPHTLWNADRLFLSSGAGSNP